MSTNVLPRPALVRERPVNPALDRTFFAVMVVVLWATVLFGFAKTYFMAGMVAAPLPNKLIHLHGAAFTLWMVLLLVQTVLVSARRVKWHMTLGLFGFAWTLVMVVLGWLAAVDALRRGAGPLGLTPKTFFIVPLTALLTFAVLVFFAYRMRRKPAAHKRLILLATIGIMDAAVGRWPIGFLQANPKSQDLVIFAFLLVLIGYDLVSTKRVQKATMWGSLLIVVVHLTRVPIGFTPAWQRFAEFMATKG